MPLVGGETVKVRMEKKQLEFEKARKELQKAQAQLQAIQVGRIQRRKLQKYLQCMIKKSIPCIQQQAHENASKDYEDAKRIADEHQKLMYD